MQPAVYMWGNCKDGRIPQKLEQHTKERQNREPQNQYRTPCRIDPNLLKNYGITKISCSSDHTCFLTNTNCVFVCGNNSCGKLGIGDASNIYEPVQITDLEEVIDVECGSAYTFFLTKQGYVFSCGGNWSGQLGQGEISFGLNTPSIVSFEGEAHPIIHKIACGVYHTLLLSGNGILYACGWNKYSQLGFANDGDEDEHPVFKRVPLPFNTKQDRIIDMKCSADCSVLLCESGTVYAAGLYMFGNTHKLSTGFNRINIEDQRISYIHTGPDYMMFISTLGKVFLCASKDSDYVELLPSSSLVHTIYELKELSSKKIESLHGHYNQTIAVSKTGQLHVFGCNSKGQLGVDSVRDVLFPPLELKLNSDITCYIEKGLNLNIACGEEHTTLYFTERKQNPSIVLFMKELAQRQSSNKFSDLCVVTFVNNPTKSRDLEPPRKRQRLLYM
ncbi:ultraviolet-B receptor UVR8 [Acrasis kona]|uniref:Ultraviolet-B receptor UVR8 n=1 Tax=Acrasis kona TaxID=1008807 RepID=A0AAW2YYX4_9EUKA